jgi:hypothetical protein
MPKLTAEEIREILGTKGDQISFRADSDVLVWVQLKVRQGYKQKGYIQQLIREDMKRSGADGEAIKKQTAKQNRPKGRVGVEYIPIEELVPA